MKKHYVIAITTCDAQNGFMVITDAARFTDKKSEATVGEKQEQRERVKSFRRMHTDCKFSIQPA